MKVQLVFVEIKRVERSAKEKTLSLCVLYDSLVVSQIVSSDMASNTIAKKVLRTFPIDKIGMSNRATV